MHIGKKLKKLRQQFNLTQKELAVLIQTTPAVICHIETEVKGAGEKMLKKLSKVFNISIGNLIDNEVCEELESYEGFGLIKKLTKNDREFLLLIINYLYQERVRQHRAKHEF